MRKLRMPNYLGDDTVDNGRAVEPHVRNIPRPVNPSVEEYNLTEQELVTVKQTDSMLVQAKLSLADAMMQLRSAEQRVQTNQTRLQEVCVATMVSRGIDPAQGSWNVNIDQGKLTRVS